MSAALNENMVRERDRLYCEGGKCNLAGHLIKDVHPYGWLTMPEVIKYSSNIGAAKIALHIGGERYSRYIQAFGFGSLTGIQFPGEVKGLVSPLKKWRPIDLAITGFGQSDRCYDAPTHCRGRHHSQRRPEYFSHNRQPGPGLPGQTEQGTPARSEPEERFKRGQPTRFVL